MLISKTKFMNYMRCNRYAALEEIYKSKDNAVVSFSDDLELEDLMSIENTYKRVDLLSSMYDDETNEDLLTNDDEQHDMLQKYYDKLEILSGDAITERFGGNIIYDMNTFNQKKFSYLKDGFELFCFLDGYQEDDKTIRIFETKATTSNKFSDENYFYKIPKDKNKYPMFKQLPSEMYVPAEVLTPDLPESYYKKEAKLFDRLDKLGSYVYDLAFQRYVFEHSHKTDKKVEYYLVTLNHEYIYDGKVDAEGNAIYNSNIVKFYNLTTITKKMMKLIADDTKLVIDRLNRMDGRVVDVGKHCLRKSTKECLFYDVCHANIPSENSIFAYDNRHHGFIEVDGTKHEMYDLINDGKVNALDVPRDWLNRRNNVIQRDVIESGVPYYNKNKIRDGIRQLKYPIYHLDFESFNSPLPRFKGESPYTQSLFQFSIHIEREPGVCDKELDHYEFLATDHLDHRKQLTNKLIDIIKPDGGSVLTYNESFEKTRIKELQQYFPEYHNELEDINDRVFDLMHIIKNNTKLYESLGYDKEEAKEFNFYHTQLNGSFSIKKVLPIFSDLTYEGMRVGNGTDAMTAYSKLEDLKSTDIVAYNETIIDLINYCKQDTWAMFEILEGLRKI